ncbi:helix-turn-helix domain-containing protein [Parabacteroides sp. APC149_11_2_Y6]
MELSKQIILISGICLCVTFLFFYWIRTVFLSEQTELNSIMAHSFQAALNKEKTIKLDDALQYAEYDSKQSPNDIPYEEKANWCDQDYLIEHDSMRTMLDDLFHRQLIENGIYVQSAVSYSIEGRTVYSRSDSSFFIKAISLPPIVYRFNDKPEGRIELRAYVLFSFWDSLKHIHSLGFILLFWIFSLLSINVAFLFWKKRQETLSIIGGEKKNEQVFLSIKIPTEYRQLSTDLQFNEKTGILQSTNNQIELSGNGLKLFNLFINGTNNFLSYEEICKKILARKVDKLTPSDKDVVFTAIKRLRKDLAPIPFIEIKSNRGKGYQLVFHGSMDRL